MENITSRKQDLAVVSSKAIMAEKGKESRSPGDKDNSVSGGSVESVVYGGSGERKGEGGECFELCTKERLLELVNLMSYRDGVEERWLLELKKVAADFRESSATDIAACIFFAGLLKELEQNEDFEDVEPEVRLWSFGFDEVTGLEGRMLI